MRTSIVRALVAVLAIGSFAAVTTPPAMSQDVAPLVLDLGVTVQSKPATVSPPGSLVLYEAVVTNDGQIPTTGATLTVTLPSGAVYDDALSTAACSPSSGGATCPVGALPAGASQGFDVVASSPTTASSTPYVTTATIGDITILDPTGQLQPVAEAVDYQSNDTATAQTLVVAPNTTQSSGFVKGGDSLTLTLSDGRAYRIEVPSSAKGIIVDRLAGQDGTGKTCGTTACGNGFVLDIDQTRPDLQVTDVNDPLRTYKTFGPQPPCEGLGACTAIFYAKADSAPVLTAMAFCPGSGPGGNAGTGQAIPSPCVNQQYKFNGQIWFDVRMLSTDPIELPPLSLGR